jgi:hypothetical protein
MYKLSKFMRHTSVHRNYSSRESLKESDENKALFVVQTETAIDKTVTCNVLKWVLKDISQNTWYLLMLVQGGSSEFALFAIPHHSYLNIPSLYSNSRFTWFFWHKWAQNNIVIP